MKTKKTKPSKKDKPKVKKIKLLSPPTKTKNSKALKKLKWKLKEQRKPGDCIKLGCSKTNCEKIWCKKHNKIIRKVQLKLNNIPWVKKKSQPGYKPKQMHLVYKGVATKATLEDEKRARKRVKLGKSAIITSTKMLEKAMEAAKAKMRELGKKGKKPVTKIGKAAAKMGFKKVKVKDHTKHSKPAKSVKVKKEPRKVSEEEFDFTEE